MRYLNIYAIPLIFSFLLNFIHCFTFVVIDNYEKYCFKKSIIQDDKLSISFLVTSYPKEAINVNLTYQKEEYSTKNIIYQVINEDQGTYKSEKPLDEGYYELCFYSKKGKQLYISLEFSSLFEDKNIKQLATDKEIKTINKDIKEMKEALEQMEANAKHLVHRAYDFFAIMRTIISSVKKLTFLKIFVLAAMTLFQIYIITKFFGTDKRVSTIKGGFKNKNDIL